MAGVSDRTWRRLFEAREVKEKFDQAKIFALADTCLHNKKDLEKLLAVALLELEFLPKDAKDAGEKKALFCTGNRLFANVFQAARPSDKKKRLKTPSAGMHTRDPLSVDVFDVVDGRVKTVSLRSWKVVLPFILPITTDNVLELDAVVNAYAKP